MRSYAGCPVVSLNAIWAFLDKYEYVWAILLIVLGLVMNLFGKKLFKPIIFLVGTLAFVFLSMLFMYSAFFSRNMETWVGWLVLSISVIVGILVGLILAKLSRIGVAVLGGWGGVCLALILWSTFLYKTNS